MLRSQGKARKKMTRWHAATIVCQDPNSCKGRLLASITSTPDAQFVDIDPSRAETSEAHRLSA